MDSGMGKDSSIFPGGMVVARFPSLPTLSPQELEEHTVKRLVWEAEAEGRARTDEAKVGGKWTKRDGDFRRSDTYGCFQKIGFFPPNHPF